MKCIVTTLNAKYIHQSLAVRLLYVANKQRGVSYKEFTIKEKPEKVADELLSHNPDVIGIGVYIWNVEQIEQVVKELRKRKPNLIIILGGPEVSYEPDTFLDNWEVDYIISGEGEFVLGELLDAIKAGKSNDSIDIDGVSSKNKITSHIARADLDKLATLPSPYMMEEDIESLKHRVVYIETSRGCPFQCQYCLSSLEQGVRYMPHDYVFENLAWLIDNGAKTIKFLDRTFNINMPHTMAIFDFLIKHHRPSLSCQFEIYADILKPELIEYLNNELPDNYFRFEIGIQSTHQPTNQAVKRNQDFDTLAKNIKLLMDGGKVDLHLDLIAGLPYETLPLFIRSFNDVFEFRAKELQLGFLKMLRGTGMRINAHLHDYEYDPQSPYEVRSNKYITNDELVKIMDVEKALNKFWNSGRFEQTMNKLFDNWYKGLYFEFFDEMGEYYRVNNLPHRGYQLEDLFLNLYNLLKSNNIDITETLRSDYYRCFPKRPNISFLPMIKKSDRNKIENTIISDNDFMESNKLTPYMITKQSAIDKRSTNQIILTVYDYTDENAILFIKELSYKLPYSIDLEE